MLNHGKNSSVLCNIEFDILPALKDGDSYEVFHKTTRNLNRAP